jgi:histidyl-tRNA synthetase
MEKLNPPIAPALPRGMRDLLPDQLTVRYKVIETLRRVFELYGFQPLETPAMERLEILSGKGGEESDKLSFLVMKRGAELERALEKVKTGDAPLTELADQGLRFELTISLARVIAQYPGKLPTPFKRYQIAPVWRAERPQHGRYREFTQCDIDIVGTESPVADAEIVSIYADVYSELGLEVEIVINDRRLLMALSNACGNSAERFVTFCTCLDKLDKVGWDSVIQEMIEKGLNASRLDELKTACERRYILGRDSLIDDDAIARFVEYPWLVEEISSFHQLINDLGISGRARVVFDPTLARGLDYYTGFVVEAKLAGSGVGSLGGGGRYDNLVGAFLKESIPAVGASFGLDRITDVLTGRGAAIGGWKATTSIIFAKEVSPDLIKAAGSLASQLRTASIPVEIGYLAGQKVGKQIQGAARRGNSFVVIMGGDESAQESFDVKRLSDGEQRRLTLPQIVEWNKETAR